MTVLPLAAGAEIEPAWMAWVRVAARLRVDELRVGWQRRDRSGSVHAGIDEILRGGPSHQPPPEAPAGAAFARLADVCALSLRECEWLALLAMCQADPRWSRVLGYLDDDLRPVAPTPAAAALLWAWPPGDTSARNASGGLVTWALAAPIGDATDLPETPWVADPGVVGYLCGADEWWAYHGGIDIDDEPVGHACLHPELRDEIAGTVTALVGAGRAVEVELTGGHGSGRRTLLRQVSAALGARSALVIDPHLGVRALRTARLLDAVPVWVLDGEPIRIPLDARPGGVTLVAREQADARPAGTVSRLSWPIPELRAATRLQLWHGFAPGHPAPDAITDWSLTPAEIVAAAALAPAGVRAVATATRRGLGVISSDLLSPVPCAYTWDDLVVADTVMARLHEVENQVRLRTAVLDDWDFQRLTPGSRGVTALFAGPSGTGKTMAAQILARELDLDLYRVDLAQVVDKYIGETEKRLARIFDECERRRVLLLWDEADALFGQRTRVKDAHDRFANIEIDYLLQRMESFDGLAVLATNRKGDLDQAFLRRLRVIVDFLAPTPEQRLRLWTLALPAATPAGVPVSDGIDLARLAQDLPMTGAEIKAVTLTAAFLARADGGLIGMRHVLAAAQSEMAKHGTVMRAGRENAPGTTVIAANGVHRAPPPSVTIPAVTR